MNEIRVLLKMVGRKLEANRFIARLHLAAMVAAGVALGLMVFDRLLSAEGFVPWTWTGPALALMALAAAFIMWSRQRPTELHVALAADERLDLREKLSTALHCAGRDDAFAQAAIEDAVVTARDPRTQERARRTFVIAPPPAWWVSPLIVLAAIMISFLQPRNILAREPGPDLTVTQAKMEAKESVQAVIKAIQEKPELSKELALGELTADGFDPEASRRPEEFKREALKKLTDLNRKLDDIINGEKGKTAEALQKSFNQLRTPEEGPAKELADALAKGDFAAAQKALQEMMEKAQNGDLSQEEKEKLAEQLKAIGEQLEKLAQQQEQLEQALKQAGMDPNLAKNPQALQQAIQNNQNLNQQQKQQLQQMANAQQAAAQMCQGLGQMCQQMAKACAGGDMGKMGDVAGQMGQQLGGMEQLQQLLQQAQAAANACKGQCNGLGQGLNMAQAMQQWSVKNNNQGGWGRAAGGQSQYARTPTKTKMEQGNVQTVEGDVIAKQLFQGQQIRGESKAKLVAAVEAARSGVDEAQPEDQLPRIYQDAQKHYFGELAELARRLAEEQQASEKQAEGGEEPAEGDESDE